jgi:hypothetical protein
MSEPLDIASIRANGFTFGDVRALCDEVEALRDERVTLLEHGEQRWDLYAKALRRARAAEAKLARVARVRDWMGENNDDAEYDLVIVALNNILEGGGRD